MELIIRQIVGRCHVGDGYLNVLRYTISRLKDDMESYRSMSRHDRREFVRLVFDCHQQNRGLYCYVMSGRSSIPSVLNRKESANAR